MAVNENTDLTDNNTLHGTNKPTDEPSESKQDNSKDTKPNSGANPEETNENKSDKTAGKKYTDDDVDKIVNEKLARWQAKKQQEIDEAKKLEKMNADEKREYELKKIREEKDKTEAELARFKMRDEAITMLKEDNLPFDNNVLDLAVTPDADTTKQNIEVLKTFSKAVSEATRKELTKGTSPRVLPGNNTPSSLSEKIAQNLQAGGH